MTPKAHPGRGFLLCLLLCFLVAATALIYPLYVIRPLRHQGPQELIAALAVLRYRPAVMVVGVLLSIAALIWYWRNEARMLPRIGSAIGVIAVAAVAFLSRVNVYEIMFHPFDRPAFSSADQSKLDGDEKVIAVNLGREARAYPIRIISYHHIINDVIGGVPIAATY
jgi:phosphoglycerol transferase MdoB-like AlkP superfamily enzyme